MSVVSDARPETRPQSVVSSPGKLANSYRAVPGSPEYPARVKSFNLDKDPLVEGTLTGIKGQYLIFDTGVINMRKYGGYHLTLSVD